ncbi:hypothetical protein L2E82_38954 [Cichorium intybus]|uniref:Uncharacterized protein n=1 Tax=Cichorium intybus TaxID=13427 RepID=A0ACB9AL91_CICIN|nr:hypothetical protein L2E82_38954 [Cichorium intybus]
MILQSDCFLFASPEYNYSVTAPLKNAINWSSRASRIEYEMESALALKLVINVAAIRGSLRKASYNYGLIRSAIDLTKQSVDGMAIEYVNISPLSMLNADLEIDNKYPPAVEPEFFLNAFQSPPKFDDKGNLMDVEAKERLKAILLALKAFTLRLQAM